MDSDAGESGGEDLDTKFSAKTKTKNDRSEQNKQIINLKQSAPKLSGGLRKGTVNEPSFAEIKAIPMKLANNAKEREKNLANMARYTQSKVDCGNPNVKKPPLSRSSNSKSPMMLAKRDVKVLDNTKKQINNGTPTPATKLK